MNVKKIIQWLFNTKERSSGDVTILYGTFSGNSKMVAKELERQFVKADIGCACENIGKYNVENLRKEKYLFLVVSTYGEGDPTPDTWGFFDYLEEHFDLNFKNLHYSICALGDSAYEFYCKVGDDLNELLAETGAKVLLPMQKCDADFVPDAKSWMKGVVTKLSPGKTIGEIEIVPEKAETVFEAKVVRKEKLTSEDIDDEVFHVELEVDAEDFIYHSGDCVAITPINNDAIVSDVLSTLNTEGDEAQKKILQQDVELTHLSADLLKKYNGILKNDSLAHVIDNAQNLSEFMKGRDVADLLKIYPSEISFEELKELLPSMQPRYYSIASCQNVAINRVDLTVKTVRYSTHNKQKKGAASGYLNHLLAEGSRLSLKIKANEFFRFPEDDKPLLMIANGVGIAPFLSFLNCRKFHNRNNEMSLFFGIKALKSDFLYEQQLQDFKESEVLNNLFIATSREKEKQYVQHLLNEQASFLVDQLDKGAYIYVCGSVKMGKDIRVVVTDALKSFGLSDRQASEQFHQMLNSGQYKEDLF